MRYAGAPEEGTAIPGVDFLPVRERFQYPANANRACYDVPIIKDGLVESHIETFYIYMVDAPGAVIGENASLGVKILDIDIATVEIAPQSMAVEGSPLSFTVTLSQPFTIGVVAEDLMRGGLTVTYSTQNQTTQSDDYTPPDPLEVLIPDGADYRHLRDTHGARPRRRGRRDLHSHSDDHVANQVQNHWRPPKRPPRPSWTTTQRACP